jgi:molybdopterin converting factor small subunit
MSSVWIPPLMRDLTDGQAQVDVPGKTVGDVIAALDVVCPGIKDRLCKENRLDPAITVSVDGKVTRLGLLEPVDEQSEVIFLPAVAGG